MPRCFFATDLHGHVSQYEKLLAKVRQEVPEVVLLGGDLLPHGMGIKPGFDDFFDDFLRPSFMALQSEMKNDYPLVMLILGNDDPRVNEEDFILAQDTGIWVYMHERKYDFNGLPFYGYAYVPPTPFRMKDWERYDVSRYVDPGCIHPTEGFFTKEPETDIEYHTISEDLARLSGDDDLSGAVMLFHTPPYQTRLDRAALDGMMYEHVPLDVHVGSIALKRFIEERSPMVTLHGHIHESSRITGHWHEYIGNTLSVNAAWDGPELSLVVFDTGNLQAISRHII
jgi:uncharacterized protein